MKKTSDKWLEQLHPGAQILDPDGWDRQNFRYSYYEEEITKDEFEHRFMMSTVSMRVMTAPQMNSPTDLNELSDEVLAVVHLVGCQALAHGWNSTEGDKDLEWVSDAEQKVTAEIMGLIKAHDAALLSRIEAVLPGRAKVNNIKTFSKSTDWHKGYIFGLNEARDEFRSELNKLRSENE